MNTPPIIENILAGIETAEGKRAFLRATEFAAPADAERFAWDIDFLMNGPVPLKWAFEIAGQGYPVPVGHDVVSECVAFTLDRWWHHKFGNRKPPQWGLA
jgi:hypothetical protein